MVNLRMKLFLGFGCILFIVAGIGILIMSQLATLGTSIDVILKENYRSVVACQDMKDALEQINKGVLISINSSKSLGDSLIITNIEAFNTAFQIERNNITLPGEQDLVDQLEKLKLEYFTFVDSLLTDKSSLHIKNQVYYKRLIPLVDQAKNDAQQILNINQENMIHANDVARRQATSAQARMLSVIMGCVIIALIFSIFIQSWVLKPIKRLIESIDEVSRGNFDLLIHQESNDEIGQLSVAFNHMINALQMMKQTDATNLSRSREVTLELISSLSTAVVVVDAKGSIDISTEYARKLFGLEIGNSIHESRLPWLDELYKKAIAENQITEYPVSKGYLQVFHEFKEYFFQPVVIPIHGSNLDNSTGVVILFKDMTLKQEQQEAKSSMISVVSHQLKSPLTSLRMAIHLLSEEKLGSLNEKQMEMAATAKDDSDRLYNIIEDLLNIHKITHDKNMLELKDVDPKTLVVGSIAPYLTEAKDKGIDVIVDIQDNLPYVKVDSIRFSHVFSNLITNAMRYTKPGGSITITAEEKESYLRFSVSDTGVGILSEDLSHVFEQFYRANPQNDYQGAGLGLAIAKEIVQAHKGNIGVESEPSQGSTFWFELPTYTRCNETNINYI